MRLDDLERTIRGRQLGRDFRGRQLRERAGLSLRELARLAGIDASTLSRCERGETQPRSDVAIKWAIVAETIEHVLATDPEQEQVPAPR